MNEIAEYLRSGGTLDGIKHEYGIKWRRHGRYPHLISFTYDQFASDMKRPICREARGIVLDEIDNWRCVCRPFEKFFNLGEPNAASIDWELAWVEPKLDGSMVCMWWYGGGWEFSTTGTPDAEAEHGETFRSKFLSCLESNGVMLLPPPRRPGLTYIFEFMDSENPIVVRHDKTKIALLDVRDNATGEWLRKELPEGMIGVSIVRALNILVTAISVVESASRLDGLEHEGFVVASPVGGNWKNLSRVKVKSPDYVSRHRFKYTITEERLMDVVKSGDVDEVILIFPGLADRLNSMRASLADYADKADTRYMEVMAKIGPDFSRKDFANIASGSMSWIMFKMLDSDSDATTILRETASKKLLRLIDGR